MAFANVNPVGPQITVIDHVPSSLTAVDVLSHAIAKITQIVRQLTVRVSVPLDSKEKVVKKLAPMAPTAKTVNLSVSAKMERNVIPRLDNVFAVLVGKDSNAIVHAIKSVSAQIVMRRVIVSIMVHATQLLVDIFFLLFIL